ncbi:MAG: hypothetical protein WC534_01130 [Candidatus Paceibacterota bacterium]
MFVFVLTKKGLFEMKEVKKTLDLKGTKGMENQEVKEITISVSMPFLNDGFVYKGVAIIIEILALMIAKILISLPTDREASYEKIRILTENIVTINRILDKKK